MKMNVSGQLSTSQTLKLPIPRLPNLHTSNSKFPEILIPNNWTPTTNSQFPTTLPSTQQVIPCQPMGKPSPNKRGRKPLSRMPETKKHIQNLTNQRAFRRRREDYVRTLENKSATYELLYAEAQNDIKMLRDRLVSLEKRLAKVQENNDKRGVNGSCNTSIYRSIDNNDNTGDISMSNGPYDGNRSLPTITASSFSFNNSPVSPANSSNSAESVEDIINDPVFCETKEGELCFCESLEGLNVEDYEKDQAQFASIGSRYEFDHEKGKRMWIISNSSPYSTTTQTSRKCCPTLPLPDQRQENYYSPLPSPIGTDSTQHHPLNLKWILGDNNDDENSDDSV